MRWPTRRMFSAGHPPRTRDRPTVRGGRCPRRGGTRFARTPPALVPGRPPRSTSGGRQTGQPDRGAALAGAGPAVSAVQRRRVPHDVVAGLCAGHHLARTVDDAGSDGVVRRLVDEDERARFAIGRVRVGHDHRAGADGHRTDVVERQLDRGVLRLQGLRVQPVADRLHRRPDGRRGVLEREPITGAQRRLAEPADRGLEFTGRHGPVRVGPVGDEHVTAPHVDVVGEFHRHRQWRDGDGAFGSRVSTAVTVLRDPDGRTTTSSPAVRVPADSRPV